MKSEESVKKFLNELYDVLKVAEKSWVTPYVIDDPEDMIEEYYDFIICWMEKIKNIINLTNTNSCDINVEKKSCVKYDGVFSKEFVNRIR